LFKPQGDDWGRAARAYCCGSFIAATAAVKANGCEICKRHDLKPRNRARKTMGEERGVNRMKSARLIALANELLAMARELERSEQEPRAYPLDREAGCQGPAAKGKGPLSDGPFWAELARQLYRDRRRRGEIFETQRLFGEPAWDILLDLFVAAKEGRRVSVTSACIGAAVPSTTGLRWLTILEQEGLILRETDPRDARRTYVRISARGYAGMVEFFASATRKIKLSEHSEENDIELGGKRLMNHWLRDQGPANRSIKDSNGFPPKR
jgi:hypothetical protein